LWVDLSYITRNKYGPTKYCIHIEAGRVLLAKDNIVAIWVPHLKAIKFVTPDKLYRSELEGWKAARLEKTRIENG